MPTLESRMILHRFICDQFGYKDLRAMLGRLDGLPKGLMDGGASRFSQALTAYLAPHSTEVTMYDLARYDENIVTHSQTLGMTDEQDRSWKPFQYIALLFTERYLDLYFQDPEILVEKLNQWHKEDTASDMPEYTTDDIHTLAFQSATGSGKTLLLHANILQYRHYLEQYKRLGKLNKVILVTPDEGLSRQHLQELQASNISARLFSNNGGADIFPRGDFEVDIIDLHKLDEKKGIKRVALAAFEENNLVMVDEGHLGTGGKVWRARRKQLARNGFAFEYSATFNQAVSGSGDEIKKLRDDYGKSILFDYSYKFFYEDGYGKDYHISNMQQTDDREANNLYLLACLLMFYQQCRIYQDRGRQWQDFNIAPPLWVFLGKTVTGGKSAGRQATETDIIRIIKFLAWVQSEQQQVLRNIKTLTSGNTSLVDENGRDIFKGSFPYIAGTQANDMYSDLREVIFHGKGHLHISHLTGADELQLNVGHSAPFGVINVGDASGLYTKLEAVEDPLFSRSKNAFNKPLFAHVDNPGSSVNIVIGARKFAAGWNSWRVSTMGLMHVGTGEGPQIIQMFGRGVRLKGHEMSLKRHTALEGISPHDGEQLKRVETLNIFGLKANYMDKFKQYLQEEGIKDERVVFTLPTKKQFTEVKDLKILKKQDGAGEFQYSGIRLELPAKPETKDTVTLDRYKHLQVLQSANDQAGDGASAKRIHKFEKKHLDLMNKRAIYHKVLARKRRFSWHNMAIAQKTVDTLLENDTWYDLYIPPEKLDFSHYSRVCEWENLAADLVSEYANRHWRRKRSEWEHEQIEIAPLDDLNYIERYELKFNPKEADLMQNIEQLVKRLKRGHYKQRLNLRDMQISLLAPDFHAYIPVLCADTERDIQIIPTPLNREEANFVGYLEHIVKVIRPPLLHSKDIYLMRNLSRGRGVSFFDDYSFYPDFILWIKDSQRQNILFIDPKGLEIYNSRTQSKVDLHTRIKKTEKKIQSKHPEIFLHSYIWSHTQPKDIGSSEGPLSSDECHENGIFMASRETDELLLLLQDALE